MPGGMVPDTAADPPGLVAATSPLAAKVVVLIKAKHKAATLAFTNEFFFIIIVGYSANYGKTVRQG